MLGSATLALLASVSQAGGGILSVTKIHLHDLLFQHLLLLLDMLYLLSLSLC